MKVDVGETVVVGVRLGVVEGVQVEVGVGDGVTVTLAVGEGVRESVAVADATVKMPEACSVAAFTVAVWSIAWLGNLVEVNAPGDAEAAPTTAGVNVPGVSLEVPVGV